MTDPAELTVRCLDDLVGEEGVVRELLPGADGPVPAIYLVPLKQLWAWTDDRIAVRFEYESRDADGQWWRSHGNELWQFAPDGLMAVREASINDCQIEPPERRL